MFQIFVQRVLCDDVAIVLRKRGKQCSHWHTGNGPLKTLAGSSNGLKLPHVLRSHEAHYRYLELIYADCCYPGSANLELEKSSDAVC